MKFSIEHKSRGRIRIRVPGGKISLAESRKIRLALLGIPEVTDVRIYQASGGVGVFYEGSCEALIAKMQALDVHADEHRQYPDTKPESPYLDADEIKKRGLAPHFKRKMRKQIIMEAAADVIMPMPLQLLYHVYQLRQIDKM